MFSKKIKSTSGASILLALLFFLLCAVAGSVVLAAGSSAAGRVSELNTKEQAYYSLTSAAELYKAKLENVTAIRNLKDVTDSTNEGFIKAPECVEFQKLLKDAVNNFPKPSTDPTASPVYPTQFSFTKEATITTTSTSTSDVIGTVHVTFTMGPTVSVSPTPTTYDVKDATNYDITVKFCMDATSSNTSKAVCTLTIPAAIQNYDSTLEDEQLAIVWTDAQITYATGDE